MRAFQNFSVEKSFVPGALSRLGERIIWSNRFHAPRYCSVPVPCLTSMLYHGLYMSCGPTCATSALAARHWRMLLSVGSSFMSPITITFMAGLSAKSESFTARTCMAPHSR